MDQATIELAARAVQMYAELHPRPSQVTQVTAAQMLGVSTRTVNALLKSGKIKLNGCGMITITEIDRILASGITSKSC